MPTLTIDGKLVTVPEGTTVLQACEKAQSPVPFYCYHPGLSIAGNCRICLVEIQGTPKSQIACYTPVAQGMVVRTTSDKVLADRTAVLEFLLANHPLDCPVCDQAGECWLQDYYMEYGLYDPKFNEQKVKKPKMQPVGPKVMLDAERCILCSRCVRFCDEITKTGEFGIFNRGDHSEIGVAPGRQVDNNYSGCVVDICPVGALTDRDFRFKCRVWYLSSTKSVCPGCSMGCNIEIHTNRERAERPHVAGGARVMRLKPRHNPDVNQWWMCDEGRYAYHSIDQHRLTSVQVRENGTLRDGTWTEALETVAKAIERLRAGDRAGLVRSGEGVSAADWRPTEGVSRAEERATKQLDRIGVLLSTHLTNEELYVAKRVFQELGITHIAAHSLLKPGAGDELLMKADKSPNTKGAQALGLSFDGAGLIERAGRKELSVLLVFGHDLVQLFGQAKADAAAKSLELLVLLGSNTNATCQMAHAVLPSAVYAEKDGTFTNCQGRVQRIWRAVAPLGVSKPDSDILLALAKRLGVPLSFADVPSIFAELASREPAFKGLTYERIGEQGSVVANGR